MKKGYVLYGIVVLLFVIILVLALSSGERSWSRSDSQPAGDEGLLTSQDRSLNEMRRTDQYLGMSPDQAVEHLLGALPLTIEEEGREIIFATSTVPYASRSEYAALPYEVTVSGEVSVVDSIVYMRPYESPTELIQRFVSQRLPSRESLERLDSTAYMIEVSFYEMREDILLDNDAEAGVSIFVRRTGLPDQLVVGREERFDIVRRAGEWEVLWQGERTSCAPEMWQPANRVC